MPSLFLSDVELGKKDDDRNKGGVDVLRRIAAGATQPRSSLRVHPRKLLKRLLLLCGLCLAIYVFVHNLPGDVPVRDHRRPVYYPPGQLQQREQPAQQPAQQPVVDASSPGGPPPPPPQAPPFRVQPPPAELPAAAAVTAEYDGPLRYLHLAASLAAVAHTHGGALVNKNVLFAAASVQSVAALLPLACQMGAQRRSYVHFAVMGRSALSLAELQQINGVDEECHVLFHDARPDRAAVSTETRLQKSVEVAMTHVQLHVHPQVILVDGTLAEEAFLQDGMLAYTRGTHTPLIELPRHGAERLGWLAELDSAALAAWNTVSIDLLIHAPPAASGSLIRLLKSLAAADYGGGPVPHLTIELPAVVDPPTAAFLETFAWPPRGQGQRAAPPPTVRQQQQLSLRHRIPQDGVGEDESAVRFLESFWPADPAHAHVLVLSPQAELGPEYYLYLKFALLEYRYANPAPRATWDERLFGISLTLPSVGLDGTTPVAVPKKKKTEPNGDGDVDVDTPFLWQAPNSNALLVLGEHWVELHRFVAQVLASKANSATPPTPRPKAVSKQFPAWLELALQLCRARGFWTLYPSAPTARLLGTVHHELYQPPEEYDGEEPASPENDDDQIQQGATRLMDALRQQAAARADDDPPPSMPLLVNLPVLVWDGAAASAAAVAEQARAYADAFRRTVGGCSEGMLSVLLPATLFC